MIGKLHGKIGNYQGSLRISPERKGVHHNIQKYNPESPCKVKATKGSKTPKVYLNTIRKHTRGF